MLDVIVDHLKFTYDGKEMVLGDINLKAEPGDFVCLLGQSGCGKSTLLRLLSGLEKPTAGSVKVGDKQVKGASLDRGVVFQDYGLFPWMKAGENIILALKQKFPQNSKQQNKEIAMAAINSVGLKDDVFNKFPKELSGGMKQRCAIARAFAIDPPILLMDEPFGALDAVTRSKLQDMVLDLWQKTTPRKTVFFVTHDVDEALLLANRIIVMGQSPSSVIYEYVASADKRANRETMYDDPEFMKLRNTLIKCINSDVRDRVDTGAHVVGEFDEEEVEQIAE